MSAGVSVYHPGGPIAYIKPFYHYGQTEVIINYCSALKAGPGGKCDRKLGNAIKTRDYAIGYAMERTIIYQ